MGKVLTVLRFCIASLYGFISMLIMSCGTQDKTSSHGALSTVSCDGQVRTNFESDDLVEIEKSYLEVVPLSEQAIALGALNGMQVRKLETTQELGLSDRDFGVSGTGFLPYLFKACLVGSFDTQNPHQFRARVFSRTVRLYYEKETKTLLFYGGTMASKLVTTTEIAFVIWHDKPIEKFSSSSSQAY